uniref:Uncharacterized protein n=1 Tax=Arundo donax TaxID=35708 RepID=A0A0A8YJF4_ARUDO
MPFTFLMHHLAVLFPENSLSGVICTSKS